MLKRRDRIKLAIWASVLVLLLFFSWSQAFSQSSKWSLPYRLSTGKGKADEATLISDAYGYSHAFWIESLPDERRLLQYARFDGKDWTFPIDIYVSQPFVAIGTISAIVDKEGILHIVWTEGTTGPAYYSFAPAYRADSAMSWAKPMPLMIPVDSAELRIDSKGDFHIMYSQFLGENQGIYYMRSKDKGITWSVPIWLDDDIPEDHGPRNLRFELDENDGLHASWYYVPRNDVGGNWVRYIHSLDGGDSWSIPLTIDIAADDNSGLDNAGPVMTVSGTTVHIIWASGDNFLYKHHRYSRDAGRTWSTPARIMGDLNGQSFDGMTVDGAGRVHYFATVRFPDAIYHIFWDQDHWSDPEMVYFIRASGDQKITDQVHAHHSRATVRAGNQLVLTFNDNPSEANRRLFTMNLVMDDISEIPARVTPVPETTPEAEQLPPSLPTPTVRALGFDTNAAVRDLPSPISSLWIGFVPTFALLFGIIAYIAFIRGRR